jgi:uncharacterized protein (TIGR02117 family)
MVLKKIIRRTLKIIGIFLLLITLYFISAFGLSGISVNSDFKQCEKDAVEIHILTNGVHTDLVLPFQNQYMDWSKFVNPADTKSGDCSALNVAFGWGDKGFYLHTKTWNDLKFSTAFNALFYLSTSAMHVTFYNRLRETESCRKICISKESYQKLVNYIVESFSPDSLGVPRQITGASYWDNDSFYEAKGTYGLFFTCNTWANKGLKTADLKACLWTPFNSGIFKKYNEQKK